MALLPQKVIRIISLASEMLSALFCPPLALRSHLPRPPDPKGQKRLKSPFFRSLSTPLRITKSSAPLRPPNNPRLVTYKGESEKSLCPFCGGTVKDFTGTSILDDLGDIFWGMIRNIAVAIIDTATAIVIEIKK